MNIEKYLRKLATSNYWQILYRNAKDLHIPLFDNKKELSGIQLTFLYWLNLYSQLYELMGTEEYLTQKVIENPLRTDAYLLLKKKERQQRLKEEIKERIKDKLKKPMQNISETTFYRKK